MRDNTASGVPLATSVDAQTVGALTLRLSDWTNRGGHLSGEKADTRRMAHPGPGRRFLVLRFGLQEQHSASAE